MKQTTLLATLIVSALLPLGADASSPPTTSSAPPTSQSTTVETPPPTPSYAETLQRDRERTERRNRAKREQIEATEKTSDIQATFGLVIVVCVVTCLVAGTGFGIWQIARALGRRRQREMNLAILSKKRTGLLAATKALEESIKANHSSSSLPSDLAFLRRLTDRRLKLLHEGEHALAEMDARLREGCMTEEDSQPQFEQTESIEALLLELQAHEKRIAAEHAHIQQSIASTQALLAAADQDVREARAANISVDTTPIDIARALFLELQGECVSTHATPEATDAEIARISTLIMNVRDDNARARAERENLPRRVEELVALYTKLAAAAPLMPATMNELSILAPRSVWQDLEGAASHATRQLTAAHAILSDARHLTSDGTRDDVTAEKVWAQAKTALDVAQATIEAPGTRLSAFRHAERSVAALRSKLASRIAAAQQVVDHTNVSLEASVLLQKAASQQSTAIVLLEQPGLKDWIAIRSALADAEAHANDAIRIAERDRAAV